MNKLLELLLKLKAESKITEDEYNDYLKSANEIKTKLDEKDNIIKDYETKITESKNLEMKNLYERVAKEFFDEDKINAGIKLSNLENATDEISVKKSFEEAVKNNTFLKTVNDANFVPKNENQNVQSEQKLSQEVTNVFNEKK